MLNPNGKANQSESGEVGEARHGVQANHAPYTSGPNFLLEESPRSRLQRHFGESSKDNSGAYRLPSNIVNQHACVILSSNLLLGYAFVYIQMPKSLKSSIQEAFVTLINIHPSIIEPTRTNIITSEDSEKNKGNFGRVAHITGVLITGFYFF